MIFSSSSSFLFFMGIFLQASVLRKYPAELIAVFFYAFFVTLLSGIVCLIMQRDPSAWSLKPTLRLIAVLYSVSKLGFESIFYCIYFSKIWWLSIKDNCLTSLGSVTQWGLLFLLFELSHQIWFFHSETKWITMCFGGSNVDNINFGLTLLCLNVDFPKINLFVLTWTSIL